MENRLIILIVMLLAALAPTHVALGDYILARAPQSAAMNLAAAWEPFLERLSRDVGAKISLRLYPNRRAFEDELFAGKPDFAFMNPYYAVTVRKAHGYEALVRDDAQRLAGIIVVPVDSPIKAVEHLRGKSIAFPDVNAMGASLLPRAMLTRSLGIPYTPVYVGGHENVYRAVFARQVDAGSGVPQTFKEEALELRSQLRTVYETPAVPSHPLIAHPRVPAALRVKITETILSYQSNEVGQALLKAVRMSKPVKVDFEADYGTLGDLHLEEFVDAAAE